MTPPYCTVQTTGLPIITWQALAHAASSSCRHCLCAPACTEQERPLSSTTKQCHHQTYIQTPQTRHQSKLTRLHSNLYICTCFLQRPPFGALLDATTTIHRASLYSFSVLSPFTDNPILNLLKGGWPWESEGAESWEHAAGTRAGQWQVLMPETWKGPLHCLGKWK